MAMPLEGVRENVNYSYKLGKPFVHNMPEWREGVPIAIVGGGPSLKQTYKELSKFKYIMSCGSVHDTLMELGVRPTWAVLCDPDPLMSGYVKRWSYKVKYLCASQCSPELFEKLRNADVHIWHAATNSHEGDLDLYGPNEVMTRGGCTVSTRAMVIALGMGFTHLHLFGMDTCISKSGEHHAYEFNDPEQENIGKLQEVQISENGPKFLMAGYHIGQLFDFKTMLSLYSSRMRVTVHGEGVLASLMEIAKAKINKG